MTETNDGGPAEKPIPVAYGGQIAVSDRVGFGYRNRQRQGHVLRKGSRYAYVLCDDGREFRVPYPLLTKLPGRAGPAVPTRAETLRLSFRVNGRVSFSYGGRLLPGTILRLNPKRAHILCDNGDEYRVSYELLTARDETAPRREKDHRGGEHLNEVARRARLLLDRYGLQDWGFHFDNGRRRAGCCRYDRKAISLSQDFAVAAAAGEIEETLLHEIAHALVGRSHHHDAVWRRKALEIGCSGKRCHEFRFTAPRYVVACENRCWVTTAERRTHNAVCRRCKGKLIYLTYSEARFLEEQKRVAPPAEN